MLAASVAPGGPSEGSWTAQVELPGPGVYELRAEGRNPQGELVALSTTELTYGEDQDDDGVTACAGDCDDQDPDRAPGLEEICGDGIDQDCDGVDPACGGDEGEDSGSFPGRPDYDPIRCHCSTGPDDESPRRFGPGVLLLGLLGLVRRRSSSP